MQVPYPKGKSMPGTQQLLDQYRAFMEACHDDVQALPNVQRTETRRAFMAGAWAALTMLHGEEISYERKLLEAELRRECEAFKQLVVEGAA